MADGYSGTSRYVAASGNGSAPSTPTNRRNNGGTFIGEATADASAGVMTVGMSLATGAQNVGASFGSRVVANDGTGANTTDRAGVSGINPSVTLPYAQVPTRWMMPFAGGYIGGNQIAALATPGADYNGKMAVRGHIFAINSTRLQGSGVSRVINPYARPSGIINPALVNRGDGAGNRQDFVSPTDGSTAANDFAASGTRHLPGILTYNFNAIALPTSGFYKPKDVYES